MLNIQIANVKNKTPKQPVLGIFGLFFHQKKLHFYHSGATTIFFQKCKKHPNEKIGFYFFVAKLIDDAPAPSDRCKHWHPPTQQ